MPMKLKVLMRRRAADSQISCAEHAGVAPHQIARSAPMTAANDEPWRLRIYTLGRFSITVDGHPLDISGQAARKPLALLKALIALGGRDVHQQKLIHALWPDSEGDAGKKAFDVALHRLRKVLGDTRALVLKSGMLTLDAQNCWVDCWRLERLLTALGGAREIGESVGLIEDIFSLHQGLFLERDEELPWILPTQERLRGKFLRTLLDAAERFEQHTHDAFAERCYAYLLECEPTAEEVHRRLVYFYRRHGRNADAISTYRRCVRVLEKTFGVKPSFTPDVLCSTAPSLF
jgi:DNA-binding SARP family transcriptional activator